MRYDASTLGDDIVFREADPIVGGRQTAGHGDELPIEAESAALNNFQGRYIIYNEWEGPIECENPVRGRWGGPPGDSLGLGTLGRGRGSGSAPVTPDDVVFVDRQAVDLASIITHDVTALGLVAGALDPPAGAARPAYESEEGTAAVGDEPAPEGSASDPEQSTEVGEGSSDEASGSPEASTSAEGCASCTQSGPGGARVPVWVSVFGLALIRRPTMTDALQRTSPFVRFAIASLLLSVVGCTAGDSAQAVPDVVPNDDTPAAELRHEDLHIPELPDQFAPAFTQIIGDDVSVLTDTETCTGCHADVVNEWQSSAHHFASFNNPYYRTAVERIREALGNEASLHCAGCHDPALLPSDGMLGTVEPDDDRAHTGVSCGVCHSITSTTNNGIGSYTLELTPIPIPVEGDDASLAAHLARVTIDESNHAGVCGSCHRAFLDARTGHPHTILGLDDTSDWQRSAWAGGGLGTIESDVETNDCVGCHMDAESEYASHRFAGANTTLAALFGTDVHHEVLRERIRSAVTVDIAAVRMADGSVTVPADGAEVVPGERVELDVVVRNVGAGHRFPGGTLDAQDTFIELRVITADGHTLLEAGSARVSDATIEDPTAYAMRVELIGDGAVPVRTHDVWRFRTDAWNHTLLPFDALAVRYGFDVPMHLAAASLPLHVVAVVHHRRQTPELHAAVCAESTTERGQAFRSAIAARNGRADDPCDPQPLTEVARDFTWIGSGDNILISPDGEPAWHQCRDHALALSHALQERLHEADASLQCALEGARAEGTLTDIAAVLLIEGIIRGRQGRTDEALVSFSAAEELLPTHPGHPVPTRTSARTGVALGRGSGGISSRHGARSEKRPRAPGRSRCARVGWRQRTRPGLRAQNAGAPAARPRRASHTIPRGEPARRLARTRRSRTSGVPRRTPVRRRADLALALLRSQ